MNVPAQVDAAGADAPAMVGPGLTRFGVGPVMRREPDRAERINEAALIRDVWYVLDRPWRRAARAALRRLDTPAETGCRSSTLHACGAGRLALEQIPSARTSTALGEPPNVCTRMSSRLQKVGESVSGVSSG